jgi:hypothetical protein
MLLILLVVIVVIGVLMFNRRNETCPKTISSPPVKPLDRMRYYEKKHFI